MEAKTLYLRNVPTTGSTKPWEVVYENVHGKLCYAGHYTSEEKAMKGIDKTIKNNAGWVFGGKVGE